MRNRRMLKFNWRSILWIIGCWMLMLACSKSDPVDPGKGTEEPIDPDKGMEEPIDTADRTVLVYMAGDNNLSGDGENNIQLMLKGMQNVAGRLVIYFDPAYGVPHLMTIETRKEGGEEVVVLDTIKTYAEENSASKEVLNRVIQETRTLYPANSYGLILWSHGMGWLPQNYHFPGASSLLKMGRSDGIRTKYFGEDDHPETHFMEIDELTEALPEDLHFILFDACFMSSIEVAYEMRQKTKYIIASPAEIIAEGFPYDKMMKYLWGGENELIQVCTAFFNLYNMHPNGGAWRSATIAMLRTSELEGLMQIAREILNGRNDFQTQDFSGVWRYPLSTSSLPSVFYDLGQYIQSVADAEQYARFQTQLERAVVYKKATEKFFGESIPEDKYSGITTYIPLNQWTSMNAFYATFSWPQAVY